MPVDTTEDQIAELTEQFEAVLTDPSEGLNLGLADVALATIEDDDGKEGGYH